jgi:hypothetical protein
LENCAIGSLNASTGNPPNAVTTSGMTRAKFQHDGNKKKSLGQRGHIEATPKPHLSQISAQSNLPYSYDTPKKSKLPHGLTVQELKEMTRARLDEQNRNSMSKTGKVLVYQKPLNVQSVTSESMESHYRVNNFQPFESKQAISPRLAQERLVLSPHTIDCGPSVNNISSLRYLPDVAVMNGVDRKSNFHYDHAFEMPSLDLFDTESFTSHSSNFQSDYNPSVANGFNDFADVPFHRAQTYPRIGSNVSCNQFDSHVMTNTIYSSPIPQFNNRHSSPRNTWIEIQNDYQTQSNASSELLFPSNDDGIQRAPPIRTRFYSDSGMLQRDLGYNRGRTASAPSVSPFFAQTRELFCESSLGMSQYLSRTEMQVRDNINDIPSVIAESILDESSFGLQASTSGFSSMVEKLSLDSKTQHPKNPWDHSTLISQTLANSPSLTDDSDLGLEFDSVLSISGIEPPPGFHLPSEERSFYVPFKHDQETSLFHGVEAIGVYDSNSTVNNSFPSQKHSVTDHC